MNHSAWLLGGYAPTQAEVGPIPVDVESNHQIPPCMLGGCYIRNGPNPAAHIITSRMAYHWFDGDGMLHAIKFKKNDRPEYINRFIQTDKYLLEKSFGFRLFSTIGELISTSVFQVLKVLFRDWLMRKLVIGNSFTLTTANTSLVYHDATLLALMEGQTPFEIDSSNLDSIGTYSFGEEWLKDKKKTSFTAHPKVCPRTNEMFAFGYRMKEPYVHYSVIDAQGNLTLAQMPLEGFRPVMMVCNC